MLAYIFLLFAVAVRFMPHPMAFTPVGAALLFFGSRTPRKRMWIPLVLLAGSDVALTTLVYRYTFNWDHFVTWAWYAAILWLGSALKENAGAIRILVTALASSVSFFLISNFAVWAAWDMYPRTFAGLMTCYDAGLPFFRRGVEGDLLFTTLMFGAAAVLPAIASRLQKSSDHSAAA